MKEFKNKDYATEIRQKFVPSDDARCDFPRSIAQVSTQFKSLIKS